MKKICLLAAVLLLPMAVGAQTYSVSLTPDAVMPDAGPEGATGFATITLSGTDVAYNIITSGVADVTAAHIHMGSAGENGGVVVDLNASFVGGSAIGSASADVEAIADILANPAGYYVQVHSSAFPAGALRGQLMGGDTGTETMDLYLPVVAAAPGEAGTFFSTDVRIVNRHDTAVDITLEYFSNAAEGNTEPTATAEITVAAHAEAVLDNIVADTFGIDSGVGAVRLVPSGSVTALARIYNDQRAAGLGTFGQLSRAMMMDGALAAGTVPFLSNQDPASGEGFRANIGWFNPNAMEVNVTFTAMDADGSSLGTASATAPGWSQGQTSVGNLFGLSSHGDFYATFTASAPIFVYGSVVDNVNGDAIYVAAN